MLSTLSVLQVLTVPPILLLFSSFSLFNFQNLFQAISVYAKGYSSSQFVKSIKPLLQNINSALEHILGKSSAFKFNLTHVLLMAVVVMLMIIYNAIDKNNKLQEKQLALLKNKRD